MRITFYDTRLSEDYKTILIKEKAVNYKVGNMNSPKEVTAMLQDLLHTLLHWRRLYAEKAANDTYQNFLWRQ